MVAELRTETSALPLLVEPDRPLRRHHVHHGWRWVMVRERGVLVAQAERDHTDDVWGAALQHVIVRYAIGGETRAALAAEFHFSTRTCQGYLAGEAFKAYTRPVLRALERLGGGRGRGNRWRDRARYEQILEAQRRVLARLVADADDDEARSDARLLVAAGGEL